MTTKVIIDDPELKVSYEDSPELHKAVFDEVMKFFIKHESFNGESICQMDDPQIDAPIVLSTIADSIIKFKCEYK